MSNSEEKPARGKAVLTARGPVGVEIQVVDTDYRVLARGTVELSLTLPEGVYMVDWTSVGRTAQKLVRLLPISEPLVVNMDESSTSPAQPKAIVDRAFSKAERPSEADHGSEVVVIVRASSLEAKMDLVAGLRLLDPADVAMRSDSANVAAVQEQTSDGYAARFYRVAPENYRLRYISMSGQTLDQTVPAMKDRRTVIFMRAGTGKVLMAAEGAYRAVDYQGVDPTRTIIVSVPRSGTSKDPAECARLSEILLHDLAVGSGSLGAAFSSSLDDLDADPLLLIYAAAVVLTCLDRAASPALDDSWPADESSQDAFREKWQDRAYRWLKRAALGGAAPDVSAVLWGLQAAGASVDLEGQALSSPPMLECAWLWAVARSTRDPKAVPASVGFRAVGRSGGGTAPWLTWRSASAKGDIPAAAGSGTGDLQSAIDAVATKVRMIIAGGSTSPDQSSDPLAFLSPDAKAVALRTFEVTETRPNDRLAKRGADSATDLATLFSAPAPQLKQKLLHTLAELDARFGPREASAVPQASASTTSDPPALRRMILSPDDPNNGRFGGLSKRGDFVLRAEFGNTKQKNRVRIKLVVECTRPDTVNHEQVEFFLHDSYRPDRIKAPFRNGRATVAVNAWGGFTVGAWLEARRLELELNLAEVAGAPQIIVER